MTDEIQCRYTPEFAKVLSDSNLSLVASTLDSGRIVFLRAKNQDISVLSRRFPRPMGIAAGDKGFAIAHRGAITQYRSMTNLSSLAHPWNAHDLTLQKAVTWHVGQVDPHEMVMTSSGIIYVNTRFSCLAKPSFNQSFEFEWKPPFISEISPEDKCHLNGVCVVQGKPAYVTALGHDDEAASWRSSIGDGGVLVDIEQNLIVLEGLICPHSPRWLDDKVLFLESGKGSLATYDPVSGDYREILNLNGFTRGLAIVNNLAFIGLSRLRDSDRVFCRHLPIADRQENAFCGISCVDLDSRKVIGTFEFVSGAHEVFDIQVLSGFYNPHIAREDSSKYGELFILEGNSFLVEYES